MGTVAHRPDGGNPFPSAQESERIVLGTFLFSPSFFHLAKDCGLEEQHFFAPHHEAIYQAMLALEREGSTQSMDAVYGRMTALQTAGRLAAYEGRAYLAHLSNSPESPDGVADHIETLKRAFIERQQTILRSQMDRTDGRPEKRRQLLGELSTLEAERDAILLQAEGWPDPLPLPADLGTVPKLTPDMLPAALREWQSDTAERMQCPIEYPAVAALSALSSLIGRKLHIFPKRHDDWREVCNLWGMIIGPPGILKSPAMEAALEPIYRLEREAREQYDRDHADDALDDRIARAKIKGIEAKIAAATKEDHTADVSELREELRKLEPRAAPIRRYVVHDPTIEALGPILRSNPRGVLLARDEMMGWLRTMDRDGHEGDRAFYLQCWTGRGEHSTDRVTRQMVSHCMCLSVVGGIQPGPLSKYIQGAAHGGAGDDGFVQRFQLAVWPEIGEDFQLIDRWPAQKARDRAYHVFRGVDSFEPSDIGAQQSSDLHFLRFADDAQDTFLDWLTTLEHRLRRKRTLHPVMVAHLSKYRGLCAKLALLFHVTDCVNQGTGGPVSLEAAELAIRWCHFLEGHAARLFGSVIDPGQPEARALAERIMRGQLPARFTARDVYRHGWTGLKTTAAVQAAIDRLADLHWLRRGFTSTGGRPSAEVQVNPKLRRSPAALTAKTDKSPFAPLSPTESLPC